MRLLVIAAAAFLLVRLLKSITSRVVERARTQTRSAQMREQQTTTLAGILYSVASTVVVAVAVLSALPELGFNVTPFAAAAGLAPRVAVIGTPAELTMWSMGRVSAAHVTLDGPQDAVAKLGAWRR